MCETLVYYATSDSKSQAIKHSATNSSAGASETSSASANSISGPIWLPEGTSLEASTGVHAISVLEFKVIPY